MNVIYALHGVISFFQSVFGLNIRLNALNVLTPASFSSDTHLTLYDLSGLLFNLIIYTTDPEVHARLNTYIRGCACSRLIFPPVWSDTDRLLCNIYIHFTYNGIVADTTMQE